MVRRGPLFAALACLSLPAFGQPAEPFSRLDLWLGAEANFNRTTLHEDWTARPGPGLRVATPFHVGYLSAGVRVLPFDEKGQVPSFRATFYYASWGLDLLSTPRVQARAGARLGNLLMSFNEESVSGIRNESELTIGLETGVRIALSTATGLVVRGAWERTFTRTGLNLGYVSFGISRRFKTPGWLKHFLE